MSKGTYNLRMVGINVNYLLAIIEKSGKTETEFGMWLGFSRGYITHVKKAGLMRMSTVKSICAMCDADFNRLVLPVEQPEGPKPLYADDKTLKGIVETLMRIEKKLDDLHRMYCEGD